MSPQQENILSRQIKGLTWGVMLSIVGTFGTGAIFIVHQLINVEKAMARYDAYGSAIEDNKEAIRITNIRVDRQEDKIFDLVTQVRANK